MHSLHTSASCRYRTVFARLVRLFSVPVSTPLSFKQRFTSHTVAQIADGSYAAKRKKRLDDVCVELFPEFSKNIVQSWILQGKVLVNDRPVLKCGTQVPSSARVRLLAEHPKYVCRAGLKLEKALRYFNIDVKGKLALDSGLSTGGFTDCLLQHGASHVWGVDVGYGQVAEKVRQDPRVTVMERKNLRSLRLSDIGGKPVDLVTLDLSFISVIKVLDAICDVLIPHGELLILVKPQFEAGKQQVGK